jgi:hypothetical protein
VLDVVRYRDSSGSWSVGMVWKWFLLWLLWSGLVWYWDWMVTCRELEVSWWYWNGRVLDCLGMVSLWKEMVVLLDVLTFSFRLFLGWVG